jgi:hypothetical protein
MPPLWRCLTPLLLHLCFAGAPTPRRAQDIVAYDITSGGDAVSLPYNPPLIGVNMPGLLWDALYRGGEGVSAGLSAASAACTRNMTLIRFGASPQYPDGVDLWQRNASRFWELADGVMNGLAGVGCVHLIPTFFYNPFAFSDYAKTGLGTLARVVLNQTTDSAAARGAQLALDYLAAFVGRYQGLAGINAWEVSHELNLLFNVDLSAAQAVVVDAGAVAQAPWVSPRNGTKADRLDGTDSITTELGVALLQAWAARVRNVDPHKRPVSSGLSVPRVNAQALRLSGALAPDPTIVGAPDSKEQFLDYLNYTHKGMDWISLHFSDAQPSLAVEPPRWPPTYGRKGVMQVLQLATALAANTSKFVFVGSFGGVPNASNPAAPRPFVNATIEALQLLAQGADAAAAAPGALGLVTYAALANWMYGPANGSLMGAVWPNEAAGVVEAVRLHNLLHIEKPLCTPGVCCPPAYLQAYADAKARGLLAMGDACAARMALLSMQQFGPPVSFDVFTVMCKGECRRYSAVWRWLQSALNATSCTCKEVFEGVLPGGSFWCPRSPADMLCTQTGWCFDPEKYENYTCSAGACGRWELNSDAYNKARSKCGVNYDGAASTSLSVAVAVGALAFAVGAAARWD